MNRRIISLIAVGGLILMSACSSDDTSTSDDTTAPSDITESVETDVSTETSEPGITGPPATEPQTTEPADSEPEATQPATSEPAHTLEFVGCEQVAIYLPVDAANTAGRVAANADLVVENDRVTSLYLAHECADTIVDGVSAGAARVNAQWLPVAGPDEVREVPEFEGAPVLPTAYWTSVLYETDNPTLQDLATAAGIDMILVDSITFVPYSDVVNVDGFYEGQSGTVTATSADPTIDYTWSVAVFAPSTVTVGDMPTVFVHVVDGFETETLGSIRVADVPGGILLEADGPNEPIGGVPGEPGLAFTTTFDSQILTTVDSLRPTVG